MYSANALQWLEILLQERFGHCFNLKEQANGTLILTLDDEKSITLEADSSTFTHASTQLTFTHWDSGAESWQSALGSPLPTPGKSQLASPLIVATEWGFHVAYDILGMTYWMLTRQEEVNRADLDEHDRFPATSSHAYLHHYLERPIVDEWLHILGQIIERTWPRVTLRKHNFSMRVSHDVDNPSQYAFKSWPSIIRLMARHLLKRNDLQTFVQAPYMKLASNRQIQQTDRFNTFDWIMDSSERYGLISAFYFICGHTSPYDADYEIEDPRIRQLMHQIHARGHEIGLHPSYGTYKKPELIHQEANRLRKVCAEEKIQQAEWGGRMHYLRWQQPTTLRAWADAGMTYDSTLGYADKAGFRCGTCYEYPAFDPIANEAIPLRIRPLISMECTVMSSRYMNLGTSQEAFLKFAQLKHICKILNGNFTLLWHNSSFLEEAERELYLDIIKH